MKEAGKEYQVKLGWRCRRVLLRILFFEMSNLVAVIRVEWRVTETSFNTCQEGGTEIMLFQTRMDPRGKILGGKIEKT